MEPIKEYVESVRGRDMFGLNKGRCSHEAVKVKGQVLPGRVPVGGRSGMVAYVGSSSFWFDVSVKTFNRML